MWLEEIDEPADLRALSFEELEELAGEIRDFIVLAVAENSGHLGSNLGAVELTLALHRVFESPTDAILWDTGHQAYVHKLVTGRRDGFAQPAPGRWTVRVPVPRREPARLHREQPRLDRAVLRLRAGRRSRRRHRPAPAHRRRDRRRLDDRGHGVRGDQQPRPQRSARDHRPQRQRAQLCADGVQPHRPAARRGPRARAEPAAHRARRRVDVARPHQHPPQPDVRAAPAAARGLPP